MRTLTFDAETTIRNQVGTNSGSPFWPDNELVVMGYKWMDNSVEVRWYPKEFSHLEKLLEKTDYLVMQNGKFDLHWLRREGLDFHSLLQNTRLKYWDTSIAEYILTAQEEKFPSLDDMAPRYGGTKKIDKIKELWDHGIDTPDIDPEMLEDYLIGDVENTYKVFLGQYAEAEKRGILTLMGTIMEAALCVEEMEYNGMHLDVRQLTQVRAKLEEQRNQITENIYRVLHKNFPDVKEWNLNSKDQLSAAFFGGTVKWQEREQIGVYKTGQKVGQPRYRVHKMEAQLPRKYEPDEEWKTKKDGVYSVDEDTLLELESRGSGFAKLLLDFRAVDKEYTTYATGLLNLVYPDGCIHPDINQTKAITGRLSCSNPNLQNQPKESDTKKAFVSRFKEGAIISADFKQLEVIALAHLSQDPVLIGDILGGVDMHRKTASAAWGLPEEDVSDDLRRTAKKVVFGSLYGGGPVKLSRQAKIPQETAKAIIDAFYARYEVAKQWQKDMLEQIESDSSYEGDRAKNGVPCRRSYHTSQTGRRYLFVESEAPSWIKAEVNFKPTEPKNYPVQGLATGDIVPMMMGVLYRKLLTRPDLHGRLLLVNQVHDSIIADCHPDVVDDAVQFMTEVLESAPQEFERFGRFDLPLKIDCGIGKSWYECDK